MRINMNNIDDYAVNKENKIVRYYPLLDDVVGYTHKRFIYGGEVVAVRLPIVQPISNREFIKRLVYGLFGAIMFYVMLVLMIGLAPMPR